VTDQNQSQKGTTTGEAPPPVLSPSPREKKNRGRRWNVFFPGRKEEPVSHSEKMGEVKLSIYRLRESREESSSHPG